MVNFRRSTQNICFILFSRGRPKQNDKKKANSPMGNVGEMIINNRTAAVKRPLKTGEHLVEAIKYILKANPMAPSR